jgi:hypothetical protein
MLVVSFDCGIVTLAFCIVKIMEKSEILVALNDINAETNIDEKCKKMEHLRTNIIRIIAYEPGATIMKSGKNTSEFKRISNLFELLDKFHEKHDLKLIDKVLIEYQMKSNTTSPLVYYSLAAYYTSKNMADKLLSVSAQKKNKLTYDLSNAVFKEKYKSAYYANKMHSVHNFNVYLENGLPDNSSESNTILDHNAGIIGRSEFDKLKCKRDLADAFNQAFSWYCFS